MKKHSPILGPADSNTDAYTDSMSSAAIASERRELRIADARSQLPPEVRYQLDRLVTLRESLEAARLELMECLHTGARVPNDLRSRLASLAGEPLSIERALVVALSE